MGPRSAGLGSPRWWYLGPLLSLTILAFLLTRVEAHPKAVFTALPWPTHLLALLAWGASLAARGTRIHLLGKVLGHSLAPAASASVQLVGEGAAAVTPSRSGSDPARALALKSMGVPISHGAVILLGDLMAEGLIVFMAVPVVWLCLSEERVLVLGLLPYAFAAGWLPLLVGLWARRSKPSPAPRRGRRASLEGSIEWGPLGRWALPLYRLAGDQEIPPFGSRRWLDSFHQALRRLFSAPAKTWLAVFGASAVHLAARLAVLPLLLLPRIGAPAWEPGFQGWEILVAWPLFFFYALSLFFLPGGGGTVEYTFLTALEPVLGEELTALVLIWWRFYTFWLGAALGGLWVLLGPWKAAILRGLHAHPQEGSGDASSRSPLGSGVAPRTGTAGAHAPGWNERGREEGSIL